MGRRCEEPHCLEIVPDRLFESHQDQHIAERLAAEEWEAEKNIRSDETLAQALAFRDNDDGALHLEDEDVDYQLALALNREFRTEEEERSFRDIQAIIM